MYKNLNPIWTSTSSLACSTVYLLCRPLLDNTRITQENCGISLYASVVAPPPLCKLDGLCNHKPRNPQLKDVSVVCCFVFEVDVQLYVD